MDSNIKYLLTYCQDKPELYNKVATKLWVEFGMRSAEINLLCTYMINEWRTKDEYRNADTGSDKKMGRRKTKKKDNAGGNGTDNGSIQGTYIELRKPEG